MNIRIRRISLASSIIMMVFGSLITLLSIFSYEGLANFICICIGLLIIIVNIFPLAIAISLVENDKRYIPDLILTIISIVVGIIFMIDRKNIVISIILAIILIILPIIRIALASNKKDKLKEELPLLIIGVVLAFNVGDLIFQIALISFGAIIFIYGLISLFIYLNEEKEINKAITSNKDKSKNDDYIDAEVKEIK